MTNENAVFIAYGTKEGFDENGPNRSYADYAARLSVEDARAVVDLDALNADFGKARIDGRYVKIPLRGGDYQIHGGNEQMSISASITEVWIPIV